MLRSKVEVYIHFVWTTWNRQELIRPEIERSLHRSIAAEAVRKGCTVLAINGTANHIHIIVKMPSVLSCALLVKQMKGASSTLCRKELLAGEFFGWQDRYGAFSVSPWDLDRVVGYVKRQKEHHGVGAVTPTWEESEEFADVP